MIQQYYGTTKTQVYRHVDQTGAGHPPEEYENDLVDDVVESQDPNIRHDAIPTADHEAPLTAPELLAAFSEAIATLRNDEHEGILRSIVGHAIVWDPVDTGFSYYFPMGHGPCGVTNPHGSWSTHRRTTLCTIHDPWGMRMLYDP